MKKPTPMSFPINDAKRLAIQMRTFLAATEEHANTERNSRAEEQRCEVVRLIDWQAFNTVIEDLEFIHENEE